ncbi:MAG: peptidylprolyl isomerase, partial [Bacteroidales bacterium]|nr:peptidylprolyl isomerase [Bacteroidales bacterium]
MKHILLFTTFIFTLQLAVSQTNSEVLMKIDSKEISKDEFLRIYNKNKNIAEDHQKSIDEYIDLFINYKLKVLEAENLGYDTMSSFVKEMDTYTTQLTDSYFENEDKLDSLVVEAYERSLEEVTGRHILFQISYNSLPQDTIKIYDSIMKVRAKLVAGEPFEKVLDEATVDPNHKVGGNLGWFSAFRMVYPFELAAYKLPIGEVSMPVRTNFGYHLIIIDGHRKNRGLIEASHIMTVFPKNATDAELESAKLKIDSAYSELQQGTDWKEVAKKYSEHLATSGQGGYLGWLGSKNAPEILLDSCFAIDSGTYSQPFLSPYGYHIVKRHANKPVPPFEEVKEEYKNNMRRNLFVKKFTRDEIIKNIKKEYGFEYFKENLDTIYSLLDSNIFKYKWDPDIAKDLTKPVFTIGDKDYTQYEFAQFISKQRKNINAIELINWFYKQVPEFIEI